MTFEDLCRRSDRVVLATVQAAGAGTAALPDGRSIPLGVKDPESGLVFTSYRVHIAECLFDGDGSCRAGDSEIFLPGGTVYETVEGAQRLRTWEVAGAAGAPLPPPGTDVVLFLTEHHGRFLPINDPGARVRVDRSSGSPAVILRLASPAASAASVKLERVKELIALVRPVPAPSSGMRHAIPDRATGSASDGARSDVGHDSPRLRPGKNP
jgi:hypothetical protein